MPRIQFIITINTDEVPGQWYDSEHFQQYFENILSMFPAKYEGRVVLNTPIFGENCLNTYQLVSQLGMDDATSFIDWAGPRRFVDEEGKPSWWMTDFMEWMNNAR